MSPSSAALCRLEILLFAGAVVGCGPVEGKTPGSGGGSTDLRRVMESEPNDDPSTATPATVGSVIVGTASGDSEGDYYDYFAFEANAGTIVEVSLVGATQPDEAVWVSLEADLDSNDYGREARLLDSGRQFFIATAETHYLSVSSDITVDYEIAFRFVEPRPLASLTEGVTVTGELEGGSVDIYVLPGAGVSTTAAVFAERLADESDLDPMLFVYSRGAGLIGSNDDLDGSVDSEVVFQADAGQEVWVVVDAYLHGMESNHYELLVARR